jgi:protein-S-isoprenylcysteine O-methyltransferase Ste14
MKEQCLGRCLDWPCGQQGQAACPEALSGLAAVRVPPFFQMCTILIHKSEMRINRMAKDGFLKRHGIVRNAIKKDLLYFAIPALLVFSAGLIVSALNWINGVVPAPDDLYNQSGERVSLSILNIVGLLLFIIGFSIELAGQITLRRSYSSTLVIKDDHQLVTHGIYRFIRHPMYLGVIMVAVGIAAYSLSLGGIVIMLALVPIFLIRIKIEEKLLTDEFGDSYLSYKKSTRKLIPFLY